LYSTKWRDGKKKKKGWKLHSSKKKKIPIEESVGNEENGYPVPDPNKTTINISKASSDTHKKPSKKKSWKKSLRNSWKRY
jgi:hypothetical protein